MKNLGFATTVILLIAYALVDHIFLTPKIAFVDTGKLLVGFSEAAKVEKEIKTEDDKWQAQLKILQDSLQSTINLMSKNYDNAPVAKKKEFQDQLSARNQQINNFRQANLKKMEELRQKKMQGVFEKVNLFVAEYGKSQRYSILFGTAAGGSILYGNEKDYDVTDKVIKGLNERYK